MISNRFARLGLASVLVALSACATVPPEPAAVAPAVEAEPVVAAPVETAASAHDRLFKLFKDSDEANLKRNPLNALFRGDMRYADQLGDDITDEYYAAERAAGEAELAALRTIDRNVLNADRPIGL